MKKNINLESKVILLLTVLLPLSALFVEKGSIVKLLNTYHSPFFDVFFRNWTRIGELYGYAFFGLVVLVARKTLFLRYFVAIVMQILTALFLKWIVFPNCPRPMKWFSPEEWVELHKVPGFSHSHYHAFPSGHTMTAFVVCSFIIFFISKSRLLSAFLFLVAFLVGISRMYLLQHFYIDIAFGSLLGMICAICSIFVPEKFIYTK